jgi:hypothetical protein
MTDEQFQALRKLILDQTVEIKALAIAVRAMDRRLVAVEAKIENGSAPSFFTSDELLAILGSDRTTD